MTFQVFISYSHQDEWLKDELMEHLSGLKRNGVVDAWHDRKIAAGSLLNEEIQNQIESSDVFLFLISPSFLNSDYCVEEEYLRAKKRHEIGEAIIVPVIVRDCDWDVHGLQSFLALPTDAKSVTENGASRSEVEQRDAKWLEVVRGLKKAIEAHKKKLTPPHLEVGYRKNLFITNEFRHPSLSDFDASKFWVDPELYFEKRQQHVSTLVELVRILDGSAATVITGPDRAGKSILAKTLQVKFCSSGNAAILIKGRQIRNRNVIDLLNKETLKQFGSQNFPKSRMTVIIDDFDACTLPDSVKEAIVREVSVTFKQTVVFSFSSAPTVFYAPDDLPNPLTLSLLPIGDDKIYEIVKTWKAEAGSDVNAVLDSDVVQCAAKVSTLFNQTEAEKYPAMVVTFLELLDSALGGDIAPSSFASCYETLVQNRLLNGGCDPRQLDEFKNFLSLVAYRCFQENRSGFLSEEAFSECLEQFEEQYLSSQAELKSISLRDFLYENGQSIQFLEDYIWYFLCARYVGKRLQRDNHQKYVEFLSESCRNIFQKKYANIVIYLAYFTEDNAVLHELMKLLDELFSKASDWRLSDESRSIILGLANVDHLAISSSSEIEQNRAELLKEELNNIVDNAEEVVARYTLPFIEPHFGDSELVENISKQDINGASYSKSVNALLRTHSVIGHILNGRSGTYGAELVISCIEKMVQASGRYASLNHSIATLLIYDRSLATEAADAVMRVQGLTEDEKYNKVMRIFAFWSVFLSQTGLARYLSQEHSMKALERLVERHETVASADGHIPFNFSSVLLIARLYASGEIDRAALDAALAKYGKDSSLFAVLRATIHIYSFYMPMTATDKQWLSSKLDIPVRKLEMQSYRASRSRDIGKQKILDFNPSVEEEK